MTVELRWKEAEPDERVRVLIGRLEYITALRTMPESKCATTADVDGAPARASPSPCDRGLTIGPT